MSLLLANRLVSTAARRSPSSSSSSLLFQSSTRSFASVGDQLPSVELHLGFPPKKYNLADFAKHKSILLVGLPGAFTPT
jgi:hypothetical protein